MKTRVRLISTVLAAMSLTSGSLLAATPEGRSNDAQAQAAQLLSRAWTPVAPDTHSMATMSASRVDAQARAAALLSQPQSASAPASMSRLSQAMAVDGQARAAALLSPM